MHPVGYIPSPTIGARQLPRNKSISTPHINFPQWVPASCQGINHCPLHIFISHSGCPPVAKEQITFHSTYSFPTVGARQLPRNKSLSTPHIHFPQWVHASCQGTNHFPLIPGSYNVNSRVQAKTRSSSSPILPYCPCCCCTLSIPYRFTSMACRGNFSHLP
jgi:hypothetical protein